MPPHSTRCSCFGISALPKFGPDFLECDRGKPADGLRRQSIALVNVLTVPSTSKRFDNPGCFSAMPVESIVEPRSRLVVLKPLPGANMIPEFAAQIVGEAALRQPRKELAR